MKFTNLHAVGYPDHEVSDEGVVRRVSTGRVISPYVDKDGYRCVSLSHGGDQKGHKVHRLVCSAFHGAPEPGNVARHLDGNPKNNRSDNLAWGSQSDNEQDKIRHGRHPKLVKTRCPYGHRYQGLNIKRSKAGNRVCRSCDNGAVFYVRHATKIHLPREKAVRKASDFYYQKYLHGDRSPAPFQIIIDHIHRS